MNTVLIALFVARGCVAWPTTDGRTQIVCPVPGIARWQTVAIVTREDVWPH
jgi:hypothetical protein